MLPFQMETEGEAIFFIHLPFAHSTKGSNVCKWTKRTCPSMLISNFRQQRRHLNGKTDSPAGRDNLLFYRGQ